MKQWKKWTLLIINTVIVVWTSFCILGFFTGRGDGNMNVVGTACFRYFTIDSNVLLAISSLLMIPYNVRSLIKKKQEPRWTILFSYVGTTAVTVTFLTVILFLGPTLGYGLMIEGYNLYLHIIGPVLAMASFVLFQSNQIKMPEIFLSVLPTFLYGTLYLIMVVFITEKYRGWEDFYGFNIAGYWYLSYIVMNLFTLGLGALLRLLHNKQNSPKLDK